MSVDRAVALLQSKDVTDNRNGAALIINAAATSANIPDILNNRIIELLLPKMSSSNSDLVMKCCWAINNLCVHDSGRNAVYKAGVLQHFGSVLNSSDTEVIKKACWALTNLARNAQAQKDIVRGTIFSQLIKLLTTGKDDEEKGFPLQPLCNLVFDAENQLAFLKSGGIPPTVRLLSAHNDKTKELAVTLVSFVTTNHDSIREELVDSGVLPPLCALIRGSGNVKMQEHAINSLVNLSLSEKAERAILVQNAVEPIIGLLNSDVPKLQQQSAMLLSNLLTNREIREATRYFAWADPVIKLVGSDDPQTLQQVLRVIINITSDAHCRCILQRKKADKAVDSASKRTNDPTIKSLSTTAMKNLAVPCATDVQSDVDNAERGGKFKSVSAPTAKKAAGKEDDFSELDEVIGNISGNKRGGATASSGRPAQSKSNAVDDLDSLLGDFNKPAPSSSSRNQTSYNAGNDLDDLLDQVSAPPRSQPVSKPAPVKSNPAPAKKGDLDDIDDLLAGINSKPSSSSNRGPTHSTSQQTRAAPSAAKQATDDIDDLLKDFEPSPARSSYKPPSKPQSDLDDIDSLLADIDSGPKRNTTSVSSHSHSHHRGGDDDDLDDLLSDIDRTKRDTKAFGGGDDIDDLLGEISGSSSKKQASSDGLEAIDDLLADLTG